MWKNKKLTPSRKKTLTKTKKKIELERHQAKDALSINPNTAMTDENNTATPETVDQEPVVDTEAETAPAEDAEVDTPAEPTPEVE